MKGRPLAQSLTIKRVDYLAMLAHLQAVYPLEGCGLLAGRAGRVQRVYPVDNALRSPTEYEMDPHQQLKAMLDLEDAGLELLAIYHSHPQGPQEPSPTDVARAYYPEAAQIIVSLADPQRPSARAFSIAGGQVEELLLEIV